MSAEKIVKLNGLAERNSHIATLLNVAASLVSAARTLIPIVPTDSADELSTSDNLCVNLAQIEDELQDYYEIVMHVVYKYYPKE